MTTVAATVTGLWIAARSWEQFRPLLTQPRDAVHLALTLAIAIATLVVALVPQGTPRRRRTMIAAVVLLVLAAQAWVGALMLFDGSDGAAPLWRFRPPTIQRPD